MRAVCVVLVLGLVLCAADSDEKQQITPAQIVSAFTDVLSEALQIVEDSNQTAFKQSVVQNQPEIVHGSRPAAPVASRPLYPMVPMNPTKPNSEMMLPMIMLIMMMGGGGQMMMPLLLMMMMMGAV